jgi:hypothetical protein
MKNRVTIAALSMASLLTVAMAAQRGPTPVALEQILKAEYKEVNKIKEIPPPVLTALLSLMKHDPRLANPGEPFNATDVVDTNVPMRRLIFTAGTPTGWLICYEHGGRGYMRHLVVFGRSAESVECRCSGAAQTDIKSMSALKKAAEKGLISCDPCSSDGYF